jgi:phosphopantothenoylcysteine synthetase/decarboxylase
MGYAIASSAVEKGYEVSYIAGPIAQRYQSVEKALNIKITSTLDMLTAVSEQLTSNSVLIMAAAPADYRPEFFSSKKIKKRESNQLRLVPNPDILKSMAVQRESKELFNCYLVGFAAETDDGPAYAQQKLIEKNLDLIFLNDLRNHQAGFGVNTNILTVFRANGSSTQWDLESKEILGSKIINEVESFCLPA